MTINNVSTVVRLQCLHSRSNLCAHVYHSVSITIPPYVVRTRCIVPLRVTLATPATSRCHANSTQKLRHRKRKFAACPPTPGMAVTVRSNMEQTDHLRSSSILVYGMQNTETNMFQTPSNWSCSCHALHSRTSISSLLPQTCTVWLQSLARVCLQDLLACTIESSPGTPAPIAFALLPPDQFGRVQAGLTTTMGLHIRRCF